MPFLLLSSIMRNALRSIIIVSVLVLALVSCGGNNTDPMTTTGSSTLPRVNGFGPMANHPHALLVLPHHVLLLATHYGLFRSADDGASWQEVAGGPDQVLAGMMTYSLTTSMLDDQHLYVLTEPVSSHLKGTLGLYRSSDQGRTWKLVRRTSTPDLIFAAVAGNDTPDEVYIYLNALGPRGLQVSMDGGQHFTSTGILPFSSFTKLMAIPGSPGHLLLGSADGLARSTDGGAHWMVLKEVSGDILSMTTTGPDGPIYASGDAGVYVSYNKGASFTLIYQQSSLGEIVVAPRQSQTLYAKTGTAIYHSTDGGHSWISIPRIKGNMYSISTDPTNPSQFYLSLSYPAAVVRFNQTSQVWTSLTPV